MSSQCWLDIKINNQWTDWPCCRLPTHELKGYKPCDRVPDMHTEHGFKMQLLYKHDLAILHSHYVIETLETEGILLYNYHITHVRTESSILISMHFLFGCMNLYAEPGEISEFRWLYNLMLASRNAAPYAVLETRTNTETIQYAVFHCHVSSNVSCRLAYIYIWNFWH